MLTVVWAVVGVARLAHVQASWWWLAEQSYLRQEAVAANDARTWYQLHQHAREVRLLRGCVLAAEVAALGLAAAVITVHVPVAWLPIAAVAVPVLAWIGRPADKPILDSAVVPVAYELLTREVIVRALGGLGIGEMNKALREYPDTAVVLVDPIAATGRAGWPAWTCRYGVTAGAGQREARGSSPPGCAASSAACGPRPTTSATPAR